MVIANKNLLKEVRNLSMRHEALTRQLRGRLVVPPVAEKPAKNPTRSVDRRNR
jgi:hypothetical protein